MKLYELNDVLIFNSTYVSGKYFRDNILLMKIYYMK